MLEFLSQFWATTAFAQFQPGHLLMIGVGLAFVALAIIKHYEPLLLVPIGFGVIVGNIPTLPEMALTVYDTGSVLEYLYFGVRYGIYPPLIFLGIGAMTDFSTMLSNPKLVLLGAAAQIGVFATFLGGLFLGFTPQESGAIGIIGGADGPTAIFLSAKLAPNLIGPIAIAAYSYMALVPVIQPPIMKLLTTKAERAIRMPPPRPVGRAERILFPILGFLICTTIAPGALVLLGMLFFGNLLKESLVTDRLAQTARTALIDIVTIILGFGVGASTNAEHFLTPQSLGIFALGAVAFAVATAGGVLFAKTMNLFLRQKINPLIGAAGVSAVPDSARVVQHVGRQADPDNHLLMHAMAPNVAGVIGSAVAAGMLWSVLGTPAVPMVPGPDDAAVSSEREALPTDAGEGRVSDAASPAGSGPTPDMTGDSSGAVSSAAPPAGGHPAGEPPAPVGDFDGWLRPRRDAVPADTFTLPGRATDGANPSGARVASEPGEPSVGSASPRGDR